jgi:hypothetical protein
MRCLGVARSLTNAITYFLVHVGVQDRILGNLLIFLQGFSKANKVKNLGTKHKEIMSGVQEQNG